jgi:hypothetical protein
MDTMGHGWGIRPSAGARRRLPWGSVLVLGLLVQAHVTPALGQGLIVQGSTFLGGSNEDMGWAACAAPGGHLIVAGETYSPDFPVTPGALDTTYADVSEGQFARFDATGSSCLTASYLGSYHRDANRSVAVDAYGNIYIVGTTNSPDFPVTPDAAFPELSGGVLADAFLVKLDPTGTQLLYGTFLGGSGAEKGRGVAVLGPNLIAVTGYTLSDDFPTTLYAYDPTYNGGWDLFVAVFNLITGELFYSTYVGGSDNEEVWDLEARPDGSLVFCGWTASLDYPTTASAFDPTPDGSSDAFITCLAPRPDGLLWSTFLGGAHRDAAWDLAPAIDGGILATGETEGQGFPLTPGAYDPIYHGGFEAFVLELSGDGSQLEFSTFLGAQWDDRGQAIRQNPAGVIYCAGTTYSSSFPIAGGAPFPEYSGGGDVYVCAFNETGSALLASTFLGGAGDDGVSSIVIPAAQFVTVVGRTFSADFPVTPAAFDPTFNGDRDAYLTTFYFYPDQGVAGDRPPSALSARLGCLPNPVHGDASIRFAIERPGPVRLEILDAQGRLIETLLRQDLSAGEHVRSWPARAGGAPIDPGVYWLRIWSEGTTGSRRVLVLR